MPARSTTHDRSWSTEDRAPDGRAFTHTVAQLGPKRQLKKNGDLVCYDVPVGRTGWMLYGPGEVPVKVNPASPSLYVLRTADELFADETMASFFGAAVTNGHPDLASHPEGVTPDNFKELAVGYAVNPRRGTDGDEDVLLCDLVITRRDAIEAVRSGTREVSAGYDARYVTVRPGVGQQRDIFANHIALVDKGRCGPRCAIGDQASQPTQEHDMPRSNQGAPARRRLEAEDLDSMQEFIDGQRRTLTADADSGGVETDSHVHVHVHGAGAAPPALALTADAAGDKPKDKPNAELEERLGGLEKAVAALTPAVERIGKAVDAHFTDPRNRTGDGEGDESGDEDKDSKEKPGMTGDSAALATSWQELQSKCEVLVPGFKMQTFDSAAPRKLTVDAMCKVRGRALELFGATEDGAQVVASITGDAASVEGMDCKEKAILFNSCAALKASSNHAAATRDAGRAPAPVAAAGRAAIGADIVSINEANSKFWANANGAASKQA